MKRYIFYFTFVSGIFLTNVMLGNTLFGEILKKEGIYQLKESQCIIELKTNGMGGYIDLAISFQKSIKELQYSDITGIGWINKDKVVFTASPIYGKSGLYLIDCSKQQVDQIKQAKNKSKTYPEGSDYFELYQIKPSESEVLFYYSKDVDLINFNQFRKDKNLKKIKF